MGSVGVHRVASLDELPDLGPEVMAGGYCLEEFVTGAEFSVEGLTVDGRVPAGTFIYWECRPGETVHAVNGLRARAAAALACGDDEPAVEAMLAGAIDACDVRVDVDQAGGE